MRSFKEQGKFKRIMESKVTLFFLGVLILFFFYSMFGFIEKMRETVRNKEIIQEKIIELEKSKEKLKSDISNLKTTEGIEENIRDKFGLVKDGENMILVVEDNSPIPEKEDKESSFLLFFKNLFK